MFLQQQSGKVFIADPSGCWGENTNEGLGCLGTTSAKLKVGCIILGVG
jgi:hypothetical protein